MAESYDTGSSESHRNDSGTGSAALSPDSRILNLTFDKYNIKVKVTSDGKFLEIVEIKVNKDFLTVRQRIDSQGYHDVDDFYK